MIGRGRVSELEREVMSRRFVEGGDRSRLAPVALSGCSREAVVERLGKMLLVRVERLDRRSDGAVPQLDWEFTLDGVTYTVDVRVTSR